MKKIICLLMILFVFGACAKTRVLINRKAPPDPSMLPVNVISGTISDQDLNNLIENHMRLWQHIHILKKKGFTSKQMRKKLSRYFKYQGVSQETSKRIIVAIEERMSKDG